MPPDHFANFPDAETMANDMLKACEHPQSTVRVRFGGSHFREWQTVPGSQLLGYLNSGVEVRDLAIDSVTLPK